MITDNFHSCKAILLLLNLVQFDDKHLSNGLALSLLVFEHLVDDVRDLIENLVLAMVSIDWLKKIVAAFFDAEALQPTLEAVLLHVEADDAVNERAGVVPVLIDWL